MTEQEQEYDSIVRMLLDKRREKSQQFGPIIGTTLWFIPSIIVGTMYGLHWIAWKVSVAIDPDR